MQLSQMYDAGRVKIISNINCESQQNQENSPTRH